MGLALECYTLSGNFNPDTDLKTEFISVLEDDLSLTSTPTVEIHAFHLVSNKAASLVLNDLSKVAFIQKSDGLFALDIGAYTDNIFVNIRTMILKSEESCTIYGNIYYLPIKD